MSFAKPNPAVGQVWKLKTVRGYYLYEITSLEYRNQNTGGYPYSPNTTVVHMKAIGEDYVPYGLRDPWDFQQTIIENDHWAFVSDSAIAEIQT